MLIAFVVVGSLLAAASWAWPRVLRYLVVRRAREHGVELRLGEIDVGLGWVRLRDFRFALVGVAGVAVRAQQLTVQLDGTTPVALEASGVAVAVEGTASELGLNLSDWLRRYPTVVALPARAQAVALSWRVASDVPPWVEVTGATVQPDVQGARLVAAHTRVLGVDIGVAALRWSGEQAEAELGLGKRDLEHAPLRLVVHRHPPASATVTLASTPLDELAAPLGVVLPVKGVRAAGQLVLRFGEKMQTGPLGGELHARFDGYAPPVPAQLGQVVFGTTTKLDATVAISADRRRVMLEPLQIEHGALGLHGRGRIDRASDHASITLHLEGKLRCSALADAVARSRLGRTLGGVLGPLARQAVVGTVKLALDIEADSRSLDQATVRPQVGIGCGLRAPPLLPELLPKLLPRP